MNRHRLFQGFLQRFSTRRNDWTMMYCPYQPERRACGDYCESFEVAKVEGIAPRNENHDYAVTFCTGSKHYHKLETMDES